MPNSRQEIPDEPGFSSRGFDAADQAKSKITEFGAAAADKIDQNRETAASGLEGAAETLHQKADHMPGGEKVSDLAHSAADKMNATADYVRMNDVGDMMTDVEQMVKKNPVPALAVAVGLGFLMARAFSGDRG